MTLAHQLHQEGRREGLQEGRQEGTVGTLLRQVNRKFPSITGQITPVLECLDEEHLLSFGEAILFMQTPEECLEWIARKQ